MRIDKLLSQLKYTTRRSANLFLKTHVVLYEQMRILDVKKNVDPTKKIIIDEKPIYYKEHIHLMINKPKGYVCAKKDNLYPTVLELLKEPYHRFDFHIAGRLDVDTTGLLILSTDGQFIHALTHPKKHVAKTYVATLDQKPLDLSKLLEGVHIKDDKNNLYLAKALNINIVNNEVTITIDEGKFHQVKRMFLALGYKVIQLKRIKIGNLLLNELKPGTYQEIRKEDIYD